MTYIASFGALLKANIVNIAIILVLVANALFLVYLFAKLRWFTDLHAGLDNMYRKLRDDIRFSVEPKFLQVSPELTAMTDLAVEIWRIGQRITSSSANIPENQKKSLENSLSKLNRCLEKFDLQIVDYTGQKFNAGMNVDVLSTEKDPAITDAIIKTTMEPTIMHKNQVVKKAKVIVLQKQD